MLRSVLRTCIGCHQAIAGDRCPRCDGEREPIVKPERDGLVKPEKMK